MPGRELLTTAAAVHLVPSVAAIGPLRRRLLPGLCGRSATDHVALTFDDGPDPESTPRVLDALAELDLRATFFVLGERLNRYPGLGRRLVDQGHELAVHGWTHRPHLLRSPLALHLDLRRTVDLIEDVTGRTSRYWRPPHGIPTGTGLLAARRLALRPVLWTADGRDWARTATPASIRDGIAAHLSAGGVVLLHDSDAFATPGSWRRTVDALPGLVEHCHARGWKLGPLSEHGLPGEVGHARR
ncbi:MAG: polysaccharide deacetylase family protein [Jatrophihabitans sp.]